MTEHQAREFGIAQVLAITHRYPIALDPYIEILTYLNDRPVTVLEPRDRAASWILALHPQLGEITGPPLQSTRSSWTEAQLAVWDQWLDEARTRIGDSLVLRPMPADHRDSRSWVEQVLDADVDPVRVAHVDLYRPDLGFGRPDE